MSGVGERAEGPATAVDARTFLVSVDGSRDFTKIQDAIFATRDGDTVEVYDGTYQGEGNRGIEFFGKAITVRSQSGDPENCIVDCEGLANGFVFRDEEDAASVLTGFKVINGDGEYGGAVYCGVPAVGIDGRGVKDRLSRLGQPVAPLTR